MSRVPGLDTLRACAVLLVLAIHYPWLNDHPWFGFLGRMGPTGVDLFFVLSGYLISRQVFSLYAKDLPFSARQYYLRRALRILPSYVAVLSLYFLWPAFREKQEIHPLWQFLTFTMNWDLTYSAFSHAWSLCVEEHFYLLLPLGVYLAYHRGSRRINWMLIPILLLVQMAIRGWIYSKFVADQGVSLPEAYSSRIYYPTWGHADSVIFGIGIAALRTFEVRAWSKVMSFGNWLLVAALLTSLPAYYLQIHRMEFVPSILTFTVLGLGYSFFVLAALSPQCRLSTLRIPGMKMIAILSFSIYLVNKPIFHLIGIFANPWHIDPHGPLGLIIYLVPLFAGSAALYFAIEKPFLIWRNQLIQRELGPKTLDSIPAECS